MEVGYWSGYDRWPEQSQPWHPANASLSPCRLDGWHADTARADDSELAAEPLNGCAASAGLAFVARHVLPRTRLGASARFLFQPICL